MALYAKIRKIEFKVENILLTQINRQTLLILRKTFMKKIISAFFVLGFLLSATPAIASGAPIVVSTSVSNITSTSATFNGVVNPNGGNTYASFLTSAGNGGPYGQQNIGSGTNNVTLIPYTITGLTPNTTYQVKIFASNPFGTTVGSWVYFTTTSGGNNCGNCCNNCPPPPPALPSVDLNANNTNIPYGSSTTISWDAYNATSCMGYGGANGWAGYKNPNGGSQSTGALYQNTTFSITCSNSSGSDSDSVTIYVTQTPPPPSAPTVNLTANPSSVSYGGSSVLSWNSSNATACNATGAWSGSKPTSGTYNTGSLTSTKTYTLTCTGAGGSASDSVTVQVGSQPIPSPTVNISANPMTLTGSGSSTITWNSTNATSCNATGGTGSWAGPKATGGTFYAYVTYTTTFTITCSNSSGSASDSVTVYVNQVPPPPTGPTVDISAGQTNIDFGGSTTISWTSSNTNSCVASGGTNGWAGSKATSGTWYTGNLTTDVTYSITCTGDGGSAYDSVFINVDNNNNNNGNNNDRPEVSTDSATNISTTSATLNGELEDLGDDNDADVWFEYGRDRSDVEDGDAEEDTRHENMDDEDDFSKRITGLRSHTTYYFRAVARNSHGTDYGSIKSFRTDDSNDNNGGNFCSNGFCQPQAITTLATNIGFSSARLNGLGIVNGSAATTGYFEYGRTQSLGNVSDSTIIGTTGSNPFSASIFGMSANTTYYYRAVVTNQYGISRGDISTFRTSSGGGSVLGSSTTVARNTTTVVGGTARPSLVFLSVSHNDETIRHGEIIEYTINYHNISTKKLKDAVLRVVLPKELQFLETTRGYFSEPNNTVVVNIGDLNPDEEGSVFVTAKVLRTAEVGKIIVVTANLAYTIVSDNTQEEVFAYSTNTIDDGLNLGANALFGAGFLPNTLFGWLLLLLIILLIILAARAAYNHGRPTHQTIVVPPTNQNPQYGSTPHKESTF